jgi:hypothetical protein
MGALAYRIIDAGAEGGIIVSPLDLQAGAKKIASAEGIIQITLHEDSTPTEFAIQFRNQIFVGIHEHLTFSERVEAEVIRTCDNCGSKFAPVANERKCTSCSADTL